MAKRIIIGNPTVTPYNPNLLSNGSDDFIVEATEDDSGNIISKYTWEEIRKACKEGKQPVLHYKFKNDSVKYKGCMAHFDDREDGQCCWIIHKYITSQLYAMLVYCSNNGWVHYSLSDVLNNNLSSNIKNQLTRKESLANKVTEINGLSDDVHYPSAKAVWELGKKCVMDAAIMTGGTDLVLYKNDGNIIVLKIASPQYVDDAIGDIETALENIIAKYGLGGDGV